MVRRGFRDTRSLPSCQYLVATTVYIIENGSGLPSYQARQPANRKKKTGESPSPRGPESTALPPSNKNQINDLAALLYSYLGTSWVQFSGCRCFTAPPLSFLPPSPPPLHPPAQPQHPHLVQHNHGTVHKPSKSPWTTRRTSAAAVEPHGQNRGTQKPHH